jgi:hypothetical protein
LADKGDLWQSLTYKVINDLQVFVGILQQSDVYNVAKVLHDGVVIPVTSEMRGLFFALWQASIGSLPTSKLSARARELFERMPHGWYPLKASTTAIVIPARPFIQMAFADRTLEEYARKMWAKATSDAFKEMASQGAK